MSSPQTFNDNPRAFLAAMYNHRLENVETLISRIEYRSGVANPAAVDEESRVKNIVSNDAWDLIYEFGFQKALTAYLRGHGHPDHRFIRDIVDDAQFEADRHDELLRARLFLHLMSGSDLTPATDNWKIKVPSLHSTFYHVYS